MTDQTSPGQEEPPAAADGPGPADDTPHAERPTSTASALFESIRDVVDDLAERASPAVREFTAKAAELTAVAADRAAPFAKRAGEVTSDASGKLAERSRTWAAGVRSSLPMDGETTTSDDAQADPDGSPPVADPTSVADPQPDEPGPA